MNHLIKYLLFLISIWILSSCDALLQMSYAVKNTSSNEVKLFVPNYPTDSILSIYGQRKDTTLILKPNEEIIVGVGSKIDFPWGRKNIYKNTPGICGLKRIHSDSIIEMRCSSAEWKYRRGRSILKINR